MHGLNAFATVLQRRDAGELLPKWPLEHGMFNSTPLPSSSSPAQTTFLNSSVECQPAVLHNTVTKLTSLPTVSLPATWAAHTVCQHNSNCWMISEIHFPKNSSHPSFIHSLFCLTTGSKPPPKRFLHIVRSRASSFKWEYPVLSSRSSSSLLHLLPRLLVTSVFPFIFPSITCFRRQFLRKMWPIQLAFRFLISCYFHFLIPLLIDSK